MFSRLDSVNMKENIIALLSGGIDSPVAALLAAREFDVIPLHFSLYPMTSQESAEKAVESLQNLQEKIQFEKAIIFPWAGVLSEIRSEVGESYTCVCCRKSMLRTASEFCERENAYGIVTGESVGQKASQTIENIFATSSGINIPIIRPLIGMNKEEITKLSKSEGVWKEDHAGCCLITPNKPKTNASPEDLDKEMEKINLEKLIRDSEDSILEVKNFDRDFDDYFLELAGAFG